VETVGSQVDEITGERHEGHGGYTVGPDTNQFCRRVSEISYSCNSTLFNLRSGVDEWIRSSKPDVVLLWAGINDMFNAEIPVGESGIRRTQNSADAPTKIGELVDRIQELQPGVAVFVGTLAPTAGDGGGSAADVSAGIRSVLANRRGVTVVDLASLRLLPEDYFPGDTVHLSPSGAERVADAWMRAIRPTLDAWA
jgi:lysophospholipase L1-like esterase